VWTIPGAPAKLTYLMKKTAFILIFTLFAAINGIAQIEVDSPVALPPSREEDSPKENRVGWFKSNGLYGYKNLMTAQVFVQPEYEEIDLYYSNFMVAKKNGKTGVINKNGEVLVPFEFQKIRASSPDIKRRFPWLLAAKNGLWGLIDPVGHTIEPFEWTEADFYAQNDSLVLLSKKGHQRLLDRQGKTIIETRFDRWEPGGSLYYQKLIYVRQNGMAGLIDLQKKVVLPFEYEHIAWVEGNVVCVIKNKKYGLVAFGGRPILPAEHGYIRPLGAHGLYQVSTMDARKQGVVDSTGMFVRPIEHAWVVLEASNSLLAAENADKKIAVFDLHGKQLTEYLFEKIISHNAVPALFFGQIGAQKYRLLNGEGEYLSPEVFESVGVWPTAFVASVGWKNAFFRLDGKQVTEFKYGGAMGFGSVLDRDRMVRSKGLPKEKTLIGYGYLNGRQIFIDNDGWEY
jgi:hypothetical protein